MGMRYLLWKVSVSECVYGWKQGATPTGEYTINKFGPIVFLFNFPPWIERKCFCFCAPPHTHTHTLKKGVTTEYKDKWTYCIVSVDNPKPKYASSIWTYCNLAWDWTWPPKHGTNRLAQPVIALTNWAKTRPGIDPGTPSMAPTT